MSKKRVHYHPDAPWTVVRETNRVASYCGAITNHSTPQKYVVETSYPGWVTCKSCMKQGNFS